MSRMLLSLSLTLSAGLAHAQDLTIYAPSYFSSEWGGIAEQLTTDFQAECDCEIEIITTEVLSRLLLEGERTQADVVMGLSDWDRARAGALLAPHGVNMSPLTLPFAWTDPVFLPFNWSHLAFVYDSTKIEQPPASLRELAASDIQVILPDPRTNPTGLSAAIWAENALGEEGAAAFWAEMDDNIVTYAAGWSEAYGLFTEGEVPMVLSFTTSPAYHIVAEEDETIKAAIFDDGHLAYTSLAAIVANSENQELAQQFMTYLLSADFQQGVFESDWSYATAIERANWPAPFSELPWPDRTFFEESGYSQEQLRAVVDRWQRAATQ